MTDLSPVRSKYIFVRSKFSCVRSTYNDNDDNEVEIKDFLSNRILV